MPYDKKISLRVSILTVFVTLLVSIILVILGLTTYTAENSMLAFSKKLMKQTASTISLDLSSKLNPAQFASEFSAQLISGGNLDHEDINEVREYTYHLLISLPQAAKAYWGGRDGVFIISRYEDDLTISSEVILPKENKRIYTYRNKAGQIIDEKTIEGYNFDPRSRPWYRNAERQGVTVWSDVYLFFTGKFPFGVTASSPVVQNGGLIGVFGVDVGITQISRFLEELPISSVANLFIVNKEGYLIAVPKIEKYMESSSGLVHINELSDLSALRAYQISSRDGLKQFTYSFEGEKYLAQFQTLPSFKDHSWLIGITIPEEFFIGDIEDSYYLTLFFCLVILLIGLILVYFIATRISNPLSRIVSELKAVENFDLAETPPINSKIKEVHYMGKAIFSMKKGLRAFKRYVPQTLVRKLISTGKGGSIGGESKELAVLFSDIEDFTKIAEKEDSQELTVHLCEYFEEMSKIITENNGTIDKYIGDAMMAFWGAPEVDKESAYHICKAALSCRDQLKKLNSHWKSEGKSLFYTRFGLHLGEAIVGNIGSSERINYTAVGDTVNIASRLESINKVYGTQILVSDSIYDLVKESFQFRLVDKIAVKGKEKSIYIYELISSEIIPNIHSYHDSYVLGFQAYQVQDWGKAIIHFKKCLEIWPEDRVATLLLERCYFFKKEPPAKDWNGVWRYEEK